jgi:hypothetical protein
MLRNCAAFAGLGCDTPTSWTNVSQPITASRKRVGIERVTDSPAHSQAAAAIVTTLGSMRGHDARERSERREPAADVAGAAVRKTRLAGRSISLLPVPLPRHATMQTVI